jgi:hypothetical protein
VSIQKLKLLGLALGATPNRPLGWPATPYVKNGVVSHPIFFNYFIFIFNYLFKKSGKQFPSYYWETSLFTIFMSY